MIFLAQVVYLYIQLASQYLSLCPIPEFDGPHCAVPCLAICKNRKIFQDWLIYFKQFISMANLKKYTAIFYTKCISHNFMLFVYFKRKS